MKTRIQATSSSPAKGKDTAAKGRDGKVSLVKVLLRIFREEGVLAFYNGFGASMLNTFSTREFSPHSPSSLDLVPSLIFTHHVHYYPKMRNP